MSKRYFVKHKQSGNVYLVCADNGILAERTLIGTIPDFGGESRFEGDFIVQEEPEMQTGEVLDLGELDDCECDVELKHRLKKVE